MERIYDKTIIALLPIYEKDIGDSTKIILEDEKIIIEKTIETVIRLICKYYMINLKEIKIIYSDIINAKNLIPIPFDNKNIFIPFKFRKPLYRNDKAFGYINLDWISQVKPIGKKSIIYLKDGNILKCKTSINTTKKHINNGNIIKSCYIKRSMDSNENIFKRRKDPILNKDINKLFMLIKEIAEDYKL